MRRLSHFEAVGVGVQDVLDQFTEQASELGVRDESDVVAVQVFDAGAATVIAMKQGVRPVPRVRVSIVYWKS